MVILKISPKKLATQRRLSRGPGFEPGSAWFDRVPAPKISRKIEFCRKIWSFWQNIIK